MPLSGYHVFVVGEVLGAATMNNYMPRLAVGPLSSGPPGSPLDGDIWVATGVDGAATGTRWSFEYNAGSASGAKWEFIGGSQISTWAPTGETTSSSTPVELTTLSRIAIVRGGDYLIRFGGQTNAAATAFSEMQMWDETAVSAISVNAVITADAGAFRYVGPIEYVQNSISAGHTYSMRYFNGSGNGAAITFYNRFFSMKPVRIA